MAMNDLTASLDLKQNLNIYATCKQGDNLNLILSIYDNSVQADLINYNVRLKAMKADKIPLIQEHVGITKNNNIVNIEADEQLTTTIGKTLIEVQFINATTGKKKATFNLVLKVAASTLADGATISTATYTLLEELENKLDQTFDFLSNISIATELNAELGDQNTNAITNINALETENTKATSNVSSLKIQNDNAAPNIESLNILNEQAEINIEALAGFGNAAQIAQDVQELKVEVGEMNILTPITGSTANAILLNIAELTDCKKYSFKSSVTSTATVTINGKPFKKLDNTQIGSGGVKAGKVYDFYYDSSLDSVFILAKAEGNSTVADVLAGKTFSNGDDVGLIGTMANNNVPSTILPINGSYTIPKGYHPGTEVVTQSITTKGAATITPSTTNQTIAAGQYLSGAQTIAGDANLVAANILSGKTIFGVSGALTIQSLGGYRVLSGTVASYLSGSIFCIDVPSLAGYQILGFFAYGGSLSAKNALNAPYTSYISTAHGYYYLNESIVGAVKVNDVILNQGVYLYYDGVTAISNARFAKVQAFPANGIGIRLIEAPSNFTFLVSNGTVTWHAIVG